VIGLTNDDPVSEEFRPLKQIIERFNRTFKGNYRPTHGFGAEEGSVSFVTLFVRILTSCVHMVHSKTEFQSLSLS